MLGIIGLKIAHRQDVPSSAQTIAQMAGTDTVWEETGAARRPLLRRPPAPAAGRRRQVERFLVHPNEIKTLRTGEAVVITKLPEAQARRVHVTPSRARDRPERRGNEPNRKDEPAQDGPE